MCAVKKRPEELPESFGSIHPLSIVPKYAIIGTLETQSNDAVKRFTAILYAERVTPVEFTEYTLVALEYNAT